MYLYLCSYRRETARQLRMYAQLTRCFSAVAELLVLVHHVKISSSYRIVCVWLCRRVQQVHMLRRQRASRQMFYWCMSCIV